MSDFRCKSEQERVAIGEFIESYDRHPPLERHQVQPGKVYEYSGHEVTLKFAIHDPYIGKPYGWVDDQDHRTLRVVPLSELQVFVPECAKKIVALCTAPLLAADLGRNVLVHMIKAGGLRDFMQYHYELPEVELFVAVNYVYLALQEHGLLQPTVGALPNAGVPKAVEGMAEVGSSSTETKATTVPDTRPGLIDGG